MLRCSSISAPAAMWILRRAFSGKVVGVFRRAVNVVADPPRGCGPDGFDPHGSGRDVERRAGAVRLISILARELGNSPDGVLVELGSSSMPAAGFRVGQDVAGDGNCLVFEDGPVVDLERAARWDPIPTRPDKIASLAELAANLEALRAHIRANGRPGGMLGQGTGSFDSFDLEGRLAARAGGVSAAARNGDWEAAGRVARELVGLGRGLTPSGDDFLAGFAATLMIGGRWIGTGAPPGLRERFLAGAQSLAADLSSYAGGRTTLVAEALLYHASRGEVSEHLGRLIRSILGGSAREVGAACGRVLEIGSSSGTDLAVGILEAGAVILALGFGPRSC